MLQVKFLRASPYLESAQGLLSLMMISGFGLEVKRVWGRVKGLRRSGVEGLGSNATVP